MPSRSSTFLEGRGSAGAPGRRRVALAAVGMARSDLNKLTFESNCTIFNTTVVLARECRQGIGSAKDGSTTVPRQDGGVLLAIARKQRMEHMAFGNRLRVVTLAVFCSVFAAGVQAADVNVVGVWKGTMDSQMGAVDDAITIDRPRPWRARSPSGNTRAGLRRARWTARRSPSRSPSSTAPSSTKARLPATR